MLIIRTAKTTFFMHFDFNIFPAFKLNSTNNIIINFSHPGNSALFYVLFPLYFMYFKIVFIYKSETRRKSIIVRTN